MIPFVGPDLIRNDLVKLDDVIVHLGGVLMTRVVEAQRGDTGYVVKYKTDANGDPIVKDDAIGGIETERLEGVVAFFVEGEPLPPVSDPIVPEPVVVPPVVIIDSPPTDADGRLGAAPPVRG